MNAYDSTTIVKTREHAGEKFKSMDKLKITTSDKHDEAND